MEIDGGLRARLTKILALTSSPNENEAAVAAEMLQKLLTQHNLDIADLETRGRKAPGVRTQGHDLGKAAFPWKLNLAEVVASHYFCYPIVDRKAKTVSFLGRPDNIESLTMIYGWIIEQIKEISKNARRVHIANTGEHIDPLRWQLNFGLGIVSRLEYRFAEIRRKRAEDSKTNALVIHHEGEISDWLEEHEGFRIDGQPTKWELERRERMKAMEKLKEEDPEEYYRRYPYMRPATEAQLAEWAAEREKEEAEDRKKQARRKPRKERAYKPLTEEEIRKNYQAWEAQSSGQQHASRVNLEPFLTEGERQQKLEAIR